MRSRGDDLTSRGAAQGTAECGRLELARRYVARRLDLKVSVFDSRTDFDLASAMQVPADLHLDVNCLPLVGRLPADPSFGLRISTAAAARIDIAGPFAAAAAARCGCPALERDLMEAIQEAVGNAVMHGNLALDAHLRSTRDGLHDFGMQMEQRLADPTYGRRPVTIWARCSTSGMEVSVDDSGPGFAGRLPDRPPAAAAAGRGLALIRERCTKVSFARRGRRITMTFAASPAPP